MSEPRRVVVTGVGAITAQGPTADALWEGVVGGNVAIRDVEGLSMETYRTNLGGEVQEQRRARARVPPSGRLPRAGDRLRAEGLRGGGRPVRRRRVRADPGRALGRRHRHLQRRPAGGRGVVPAAAEGRGGAERAAAARLAAGGGRDARGAFGFKGPVLSVNTACAASANAIGYASRADPPGPRRRRADRRRRGADRGPVLRLQRAGVALARARRAVLARPPRAVARRGRRDAGADARGPRAGAGRADPGRAARLLPVRRRLPPDRAAAGRRRRRAARSGRRWPPRASSPRRSTTSTATAPARPRTTRPRPPRPSSASASTPTRPRSAPPSR